MYRCELMYLHCLACPGCVCALKRRRCSFEASRRRMGIPKTTTCSLNTPLLASANCLASSTTMSLSLRPDEEVMVIDWSLLVALCFANTSTMRLETISIRQDKQNNASTHFSPPYDSILAPKRETHLFLALPHLGGGVHGLDLNVGSSCACYYCLVHLVVCRFELL